MFVHDNTVSLSIYIVCPGILYDYFNRITNTMYFLVLCQYLGIKNTNISFYEFILRKIQQLSTDIDIAILACIFPSKF